ncbi:MAG: enoyl-ACP reductase [Pyrinomonadaceae bacterium]|nr:enoyl-ACP reductase [Pyrinomonadaceae bacterium]MCX7639832.1 enoyl-ACP reductase [Pyrinomonadaceae bacterium]MDW8304004.1 enoyl-ACP reductase [Acidobacteriota bacterium]
MLLENKIGLIVGVANQRSIAWACAEACLEHGAKLAFTYQNERLKEKVEKLTANIPESLLLPCEVTDQSQVDNVFAEIEKKYGKLDFLIHSIAFAPREALSEEFLQTSREAFLTALEISTYSLTQLSRAAKPLMKDGGSIVTMTYYGAEKVVQNYNVMGVAKAALEASVRYLASDLGKYNIRVNAISAGPIKTLAAMGVGDIGKMQQIVAERSPLKRNVQASEVGNTALFLVSDLSSAITGETIFVDCGYNIMGI